MDEISFTPRELDVMSILWRAGSGTVAEVKGELGDELAYTSVLSALQTLEDKGFVRHEAEGRAYRYFATVEPEAAGGSALARIRDAIFHGSAERMFAQLVSDRDLPREELERITLPFTEGETPSDAELRIAQAQLVGWLEGLFHGIQTAIYAQQLQARGQLEQMRKALLDLAEEGLADPGDLLLTAEGVRGTLGSELLDAAVEPAVGAGALIVPAQYRGRMARPGARVCTAARRRAGNAGVLLMMVLVAVAGAVLFSAGSDHHRFDTATAGPVVPVRAGEQLSLDGPGDHEHHRNGGEDGQRHRIFQQERAEIAKPGLDERRAHLHRRTPRRRRGSSTGRPGRARSRRARGTGRRRRRHRRQCRRPRARCPGRRCPTCRGAGAPPRSACPRP